MKAINEGKCPCMQVIWHSLSLLIDVPQFTVNVALTALLNKVYETGKHRITAQTKYH